MKTIAITIALLALTAGSAIGQQAGVQERGFAPEKVYDVGEIDSVSTFNGNLIIQIPIGPQYPLNNLSYGLTLIYNSQVWDYRTYGDEQYGYPSDRSNAGLGWQMSLGRVFPGPLGNQTATTGYETEDGVNYGFDRKLHSDVPAPPLIAGITEAAYTHNGTYVRLKRYSAGGFAVEFPDGTVKTFDSAGMITSIQDHFGNAVHIDRVTTVGQTPCLATGFKSAWRITESEGSGRAHYVCFKEENYPESIYDGQIDRIVIAAPTLGDTTRTATYVFGYTHPGIRPPCHTIVTTDRQWLTTPVLSTLQMPDGSSYEFHYSLDGPNCEMGMLTSVALPTKATIAYGYGLFFLPTLYCNTPASNPEFVTNVYGIKSRTISGPGIPTATWTYDRNLSANDIVVTCRAPDGTGTPAGAPPEELTVAVTDPLGNVTEQFYSVWPGNEDIESPHGFDPKEYGHPYTRWPGTASDGRLLTRRVYTRAGYAATPRAPLRSYYVQYAFDDACGGAQSCVDGNQRTTKERTIYHDDGDRIADVDYSDWDGLGHFRSVSVTGNFASGAQTIYTAYNMRDAAVNPAPPGGSDGFIESGSYPGSFTAPTLNQAWILNTAPFRRVSDATGEATTQTCYDPYTNFLRARRVLKNGSVSPDDLLTVFESERRSADGTPTGNVGTESYFGGDVHPTVTSALCQAADTPPAAPDYRVEHKYKWGVRESSQYAGTEFFTLDRKIDPRSGLPLSTKDSSGLETLYEYDTSFRITKVIPPGVAPTGYTYVPASMSAGVLTPASVAVATTSASPALGAMRKEFLYDALGHPWRERSLMADGSWSVRETLYNQMGWRISVSEMETDNGGSPAHKTTFENYDPFGRPGTIRTADGKATDLSYTGVASFTRTARVMTVDGEVPAATTEFYDRRGRVTSVVEHADGDITANYSYDVTGHLASVSMTGREGTQPRSFVYDNRGFLGLERHPENGETTYGLYDARGHARRRSSAAAELTFTFDPAERLTTISQTGVGLLKELHYDRPNAASDSSLGKLDFAIRHNRHALLGGDVTIKETYSYAGRGGRLSATKTEVSTGESFTESHSYNDLGARDSVSYPDCTRDLSTGQPAAGCAGLSAPSRTVTSDYANGFLTRVAGYTSATSLMSYHPNGMLRTVTHRNASGLDGPVYTQEIDLVSRMARPASITVTNYCDDISISAQPPDKSATIGAPANLTVAASGATTYQWYRGEMNDTSNLLAGQATATLTVPVSVTAKFWVRVGNGNCTIDSRAATVTAACAGPVLAAPSPATVTVGSGKPVDFAIAAPAGVASPHYQWYRGARGVTTNPLTGETARTLHIMSLTQSATYWVRVTGDDGCSSDSEVVSANVRVCDASALSITLQPHSTVVHAGSPATLTVAASDPNAHYQWYRGVSGVTDTPLTGETHATLSLAAVNAAASYWVRVSTSDDACSIDSATATIDVCSPPVITTQPSSQSGPLPTAGHPAILSASVAATGYQLQYQWREKDAQGNWNPVVPGPALSVIQGTITVTFTAAAPAKRTFRVDVTNGVNVTGCEQLVSSNEITIQVSDCMSLYSGGGGEYVVTPLYNAVLLGVYMNGNGPFEYQWYHGTNGQSIPAGTTQIIQAGAFGDYDAYWCVVTSKEAACPGTLTTQKSYIRPWDKCPLPPVTIVPAHSNVTSAAPSVTLTALEEWPNVTYQWYRGQSGDTTSDNALIPNETHGSITVTPIHQETYWVRVTNSCGTSVDSSAVAVSAPGCDPIVVNTQPKPADIMAGNSMTLLTDASSIRGLTYMWYTDGTNIFQGSGTSLTVHPSVTTTYYARIANDCTSVETFRATVHVKSCPSLSIIAQPQAVYFPPSFTGSKQMSVTADPLSAVTSYQWYKGATGNTAVPISGETHNSIFVSETGNYWVRVNGQSCSVDSNTVAAKRCGVLSFTRTLVGGSIRQGTPIRLDATALIEGTDLTYKWHEGPADRTDNIISEAADLWLYPSDTTTYTLEVNDPCGGHIVSAPATVFVCNTPGISEQPHGVAVFPGKTATLHVTAVEGKNTPIDYQWRDENGVPVGTNSATLTTPPITAPKRYSVHLQAGICGADSEEATVSLCSLPEVIGTGGTFYIKPQEVITLSSGTNAYTGNVFQWYHGPVDDDAHSVAVGGDSYQYTPPPSNTTEVYWARVRHPEDACVSHTSAYNVVVCVPRISQQPANVTLNPADPSVALSVVASPATAYQWYIGEKGDITHPIAGATAATINVKPGADTRYWVQVIGSCGVDSRGAPLGATDSESALVTVCAAPRILQAPPAASIVRGTSTSIGVLADGSNLTYQWYTGASGNTSSPIAGATNTNVSVSPQDTTNYWVKITGTCGSVNGPTMTVSVCTIPTITTQPQSVSIFSGASTTLSVAASAGTSLPIVYQWYRGAAGEMSYPVGTNAPAFTTPALTAETQYWVRLSCGVCTPNNSATATVAICPFPQTINPPPDVETSTLPITRLTAYGGGENYLWYKGASGDTSTPISSWQPLTYIDVRPLVTTPYWYRVQNGACTSNSGTITIRVCIPTITTQPASRMISPGEQTTLTVAADTPGLTYQWYLGTTGVMTSPIAGATGASLTVSPSSATNYWVRVIGSCNRSVDSNTATITVCSPPSTPQVSPGVWIARGSSWTLGVTVTGTNLTYQWYSGASGNTASPITGATSQNVTVSPQNTTSYWVRVTGTCGTRDSAASTISVCLTPSITTPPQSVSIFSGASTTLSVTAYEGTTSPINYQWFRGLTGDPSVPVGTNSPTYTTPSLTADTNYWVSVSCGTCNPASSATATVSICANPQIVTNSADVQTSVAQLTRLYAYGAGNGTTYTWYRGAAGDASTPIWTDVPYNYVDVNPSVTTQYWARVYNGSCVSRTNTITVNVCVPQITQQPAGPTINPGQSATLTAAANTAGVTYQWYIGTSGTTSSPIAGATAASLTVTPAATTNYWMRATSSCGRTVDSATATVTICSPPNITRQPPVVNEINPYTETIDVQATGSNLTYQWYFGEAGDTHAPISGATSNALTYYLTQTTRVWVRITGQCGIRDSNATWLNMIPKIVGHPQDQRVSYGSTARVGIAVQGTLLHYQWLNYNTGQVVPGATDSPYLYLAPVTSTLRVYCNVTSGSATTSSYTAEISNCDGPRVTMSVVNNGPNCRFIIANITGDYSDIEWYEGNPGDMTSYVTRGQTSLMICPTTTRKFWCRVYGTDSMYGTECNADSVGVTIP
jgi:hypothetical protein